MGILREFIGPASKYKDDIPYTYEARIRILDTEDDYTSYIADTICALVEHLDANQISPEEVELYEIYKEQEKPLEIAFCVSNEGTWLERKQLCDSFKQHYPGHIDDNGCTFEDRERDVSGP